MTLGSRPRNSQRHCLLLVAASMLASVGNPSLTTVRQHDERAEAPENPPLHPRTILSTMQAVLLCGDGVHDAVLEGVKHDRTRGVPP